MRYRSTVAGLLAVLASIAIVGVVPGTADAQRRYRSGMNSYNYPYYWNRGTTTNPYSRYNAYRNGTYGRYYNGYPYNYNPVNSWYRYP